MVFIPRLLFTLRAAQCPERSLKAALKRMSFRAVLGASQVPWSCLPFYSFLIGSFIRMHSYDSLFVVYLFWSALVEARKIHAFCYQRREFAIYPSTHE